MKRLLILTAAAALLLPTLSVAQPGRPDNNRPGDNRPGNNRPGDHRPGDSRPGRPDRPSPGFPNRPGAGGPSTKPVPLPGPHRPGPGMRPPPRPPQFSWRGRSYAQRSGPIFRYPPGYAYRRWSIGAFLPALFLGSTYFYDDWRGLGIDRPPPGRRWVRYGPDLVLVNIRTHRIEDVIYGAFY